MEKDEICTYSYSCMAFCHFTYVHRLSESQILIQHLTKEK